MSTPNATLHAQAEAHALTDARLANEIKSLNRRAHACALLGDSDTYADLMHEATKLTVMRAGDQVDVADILEALTADDPKN